MTIEIEQPDSLSRATGLILVTADAAAPEFVPAVVVETASLPGRPVPQSLQSFFASYWVTFGLLAEEIIVVFTQLSGGANPAPGAWE
jgi:hypothetical protein